MKYFKLAVNGICYFVTLIVFASLGYVFTGPEDTSEAHAQFKECMDTAKNLSPDADTKYMIQKGCIGNYILHS